MNYYIAHAGVDHATPAQATAHVIQQVLLIVVISAVVVGTMYVITKLLSKPAEVRQQDDENQQ